jgi:hypothetical protein
MAQMATFLKADGTEEFIFVGSEVVLKSKKTVTIKEFSAEELPERFTDTNDNIYDISDIVDVVIKEHIKPKIPQQKPAEQRLRKPETSQFNIYSALADFNNDLGTFDKLTVHGAKNAAKTAVTNVYDWLAGKETVNSFSTIDSAIYYLLMVKEQLRRGEL